MQDSSLPSEIPYMTARIFNAETSYKFSVNGSSRIFLRLHFYPSSYPNVNISNSYFSVKAGGLTLLNNFSAATTALALSQAYIIKEYTLAPSNSNDLSLTFKSSDKYSGSFAFLNGIEVIETPEMFDDNTGMVGFSGGDSEVTVEATTASMETMYRLNVGGQFVPPTKDSAGLMRSWYDDTAYIFGASSGVTNKANTTIRVGGLEDIVAPLDVYSTARTMGPDPNINKNYNLTWVFEVDANFTYLVRLHFCDYLYQKVNQRVFEIFINNQTASDTLDIIALAGGVNQPIKKDFAVHVSGKQDNNEIWVALHPNVGVKPEFYDAMLNGLEIFKLGDANSNLAGPNPELSDLMRKQQEHNNKKFAPKKSYLSAIIGGAAGGAAAFGIAAAIIFVVNNRKRRQPGDSISSWLPLYGHSHTSATNVSGKSHGSAAISSDAAANCRYFSLAEILQATKNFDESHVIGVGGFGKVYKGVIDGDMKVAIKRSNPSSEQGVNEFQTEIEMLSKLRHMHLVSLIGFCEEGNEMALVYDYMGKGTLREHLYNKNKVTLSWKQRLEICIGAARGLHYLHTGAKYTIIHRDVKTTNILLDDKWVAKVSDFGLSKTGPNMSQSHVSTVVKGSFGYLDPEYFRRQQLTEKSDVYSFGVVLFEILCGRPALNPSLPKEQVSLADYAMHCLRKGTLDEIIDPHLKGKVNPECIKKFAELAGKCLADHGTDRPSMGDVLWNLEFVLQLESNSTSVNHSPAPSGSIDYDNVKQIDHDTLMAMHRSTLSLGSEHDEKEQSDNPDEIFSQIVNQKGR
ncbi:receptor-like protein kinase ANXUR1 [Apium graveolens]|uniref:receptor-like protein kinase ANXUR1 n=1 Tax=Apium graveolens TaxID=4045 RepID=UPI003D7AC603